MNKDLLTQAAQKEAEGLKPYRVQVDPGDHYFSGKLTTMFEVIDSRINDRVFDNYYDEQEANDLAAALNAAYAAAHVKCALLYSERAAGLVEALEDAIDNEGGVSYANEEDEVGARACCYVVSYKAHGADCWVTKARAALHAYNQKL